MAEKYNGWTNYQTWNLKLWIDNEQGSQQDWEERADRALASADGDKQAATHALSNELKDDTNENHPLRDTPSFYSDILQGAIDAVNYYEIAQGWIDEAADRAEEAAR